VEPLLRGNQRLVVLADGCLHFLPLEMLVTEEPKSDNPAEWAWLLKKYEIHYAPSGTVLAQLVAERQEKVARWKDSKPTLLAMADPPFSAQQLAEETRLGTANATP